MLAHDHSEQNTNWYISHMRCLEIARDHKFVSSTKVTEFVQSSSLLIFINNILVIFMTLSPSLSVTKSHILFHAEHVSTHCPPNTNLCPIFLLQRGGANSTIWPHPFSLHLTGLPSPWTQRRHCTFLLTATDICDYLAHFTDPKQQGDQHGLVSWDHCVLGVIYILQGCKLLLSKHAS